MHQTSTIVFVSMLLIGACSSNLPQRQVRFANHNPPRSKWGTVGDVKPKGVLQSFSTPADLRLGFLKGADVNTVYCAEPMPDVSLGAEASFNGSLAASFANTQAAQASAAIAALSEENRELREELEDAVEASESGKKQERSGNVSSSLASTMNATANLQAAAQLAVKVSELGGRSQQVLLAREFLYRLCEARANAFIEADKGLYVALQKRALEMIENISKPQKASETAERTALIKEITAHNKQQSDLCGAKKTACAAAAESLKSPNKEEKQAECVTKHDTCMSGIKLLSVPAVPTGEGNPGG